MGNQIKFDQFSNLSWAGIIWVRQHMELIMWINKRLFGVLLFSATLVFGQPAAFAQLQTDGVAIDSNLSAVIAEMQSCDDCEALVNAYLSTLTADQLTVAVANLSTALTASASAPAESIVAGLEAAAAYVPGSSLATQISAAASAIAGAGVVGAQPQTFAGSTITAPQAAAAASAIAAAVSAGASPETVATAAIAAARTVSDATSVSQAQQVGTATGASVAQVADQTGTVTLEDAVAASDTAYEAIQNNASVDQATVAAANTTIEADDNSLDVDTGAPPEEGVDDQPEVAEDNPASGN